MVGGWWLIAGEGLYLSIVTINQNADKRAEKRLTKCVILSGARRAKRAAFSRRITECVILSGVEGSYRVDFSDQIAPVRFNSTENGSQKIPRQARDDSVCSSG